MVLPRPLPTPVLAFAIRHLGAAAGVMVTASHNPPQDNGYKVYLGDGSQIVPPADAEISAAIDAVGPLDSVPMGEELGDPGDDVLDAYLDRVASLVGTGSPRDLQHRLHAAARGRTRRGARSVRASRLRPRRTSCPSRATRTRSSTRWRSPTRRSPARSTWRSRLRRPSDADIVLANDPDADRCAVAVPDAEAAAGWRMLRGDEVGALLGQHLIRRDPNLRGTFAASIVSSSLLGKIAAAHGLGYEETLTGFKWISRVEGLRYGYEEALGYCVDPDAVRDKDGVSAAILVAEMSALLKAEGRGLTDLLDDLAREYGLHATDQLAARFEDLGQIEAAMDQLRKEPPTQLGGAAVTSAEDLAQGAGDLPPTDGLRYRLADGGRVIVRPSGTEPKVKCYLEVVVPVVDGDVGAARRTAADKLAAIKRDIAAAAGLPA